MRTAMEPCCFCRLPLLGGACLLVFLVAFSCGFLGTADAGISVNGYDNEQGEYEYVLFGRYQQHEIHDGADLTGKEEGVDYVVEDFPGKRKYYEIQPILWRVLSADSEGSDRKALLLSEHNLDAMPFETRSSGMQHGVGWSRLHNNYGVSEVRTFLVGDALEGNGGIFGKDSYFSPGERFAVSADIFETKANHVSAVAIVTQNQVFLLSEEQLRTVEFGFLKGRAVKDANRISKDTPYVADKKSENIPDVYLTRSASSFVDGVRYVSSDGSINPTAVDKPNYSVRPALFLDLNSIIFKSTSVAYTPSCAGEITNPYMLYTASADIPADSVDVSLKDDRLFMNFGGAVVHAYSDAPDVNGLRDRFTVSDDVGQRVAVVDIAFEAGELVLTLDLPSGYDGGLDLAYRGHKYGEADGMALLPDRLVIKSLNGGRSLTVTGASDSCDEPPPEPSLSKETEPKEISVMIDDTRYFALLLSDGKYLIALPYQLQNADLSNVPVNITPPDGGIVSPDLCRGADFSKGAVSFAVIAEDTVTSRDYLLEIRLETSIVVNRDLVAGDSSLWRILCYCTGESSIAVEIYMPFADGVDISKLERFCAVARGLSGLAFDCVGLGGTAMPQSRETGNLPYLLLSGLAPDEETLKRAELLSISHWYEGDSVEYRQDFIPAFCFGDVNISDDEYDDEAAVPAKGSGGCDGGMLGLFAMLSFVLRRARRCIDL